MDTYNIIRQAGYITGVFLAIVGMMVFISSLFTALLLLANTLLPGQFLNSIAFSFGWPTNTWQTAAWLGFISAWPMTVYVGFGGLYLTFVQD